VFNGKAKASPCLSSTYTFFTAVSEFILLFTDLPDAMDLDMLFPCRGRHFYHNLFLNKKCAAGRGLSGMQKLELKHETLDSVGLDDDLGFGFRGRLRERS
jgi:hypothetical protein